jgi:hypothetical protein
MSEPLRLARQIAERREIDAAAERWIIGAFQAWWRDGSDPERLAWAFRIPSGKRWAATKRNDYLRTIAADLPEQNRGAAIKVLVDDFMKTTWPGWRHLELPPEDADGAGQILFYAAHQRPDAPDPAPDQSNPGRDINTANTSRRI